MSMCCHHNFERICRCPFNSGQTCSLFFYAQQVTIHVTYHTSTTCQWILRPLEATFPNSSQFGDSSFWPSSTEGHTWMSDDFQCSHIFVGHNRAFLQQQDHVMSLQRPTPEEHHVNGAINWDKEAAEFFTSILESAHPYCRPGDSPWTRPEASTSMRESPSPDNSSKGAAERKERPLCGNQQWAGRSLPFSSQ